MTAVGAGSRAARAETGKPRPGPEPAVPLEGGLSLRLLPEWELDAAVSGQAEALLGACFPG